MDHYQSFRFSLFGTFLLRQFFVTIAEPFDDAARIDDCNSMRGFLGVLP
ncbi:MAG: hypothetical protein LBD58_10810 [Treponema sp.]|nr:hypothetical protein [Treponema sp.]